MPPTKMLPVPGSLREFQEVDSSAQSLQSQLRPHHVFSRCSKKTLTKKVAELICLASFCAGTVFLEYEMLLLFGAAFVVFAAACALAVISGALYRAPEGDERADGLHIRQRNRPRRFLLAGSGGFQELRTHESLKSERMCALALMEFSADIATRALMNRSITAPHITLALGEATELDLLAAGSAAPDQRHMRHSSVPRQRT